MLDGDMVFVLESVSSRDATIDAGASSDVGSPVVDLASSIVDGAEETDTTPEFAADGTSTGGIWDLMPSAGDFLLGDLAPKIDTPIFPLQDE